MEHAMPIVLGTGNFGQVYQGEILCDDGATKSVAVKRLNGEIYNSLISLSYFFC